VQRAGADHRDAVAGRREVGQAFQDHHVGVTGAHENQVFTHACLSSCKVFWFSIDANETRLDTEIGLRSK
jgi:hypothetical protein